jgi:hypothetical protein
MSLSNLGVYAMFAAFAISGYLAIFLWRASR